MRKGRLLVSITRWLVTLSLLGSLLGASLQCTDARRQRSADGHVDAATDAGQDVVGDTDACAPRAPSSTCVHPTVRPDCRDGFCLISKGCFIMGAAPCEFGRAKSSEPQIEVTLTRDFLIQQREFTRAQASEVGIPSRPASMDGGLAYCDAPNCPLGNISWFEALEIANRYSVAKGLPKCFELQGCKETEREFSCESVASTGPSVFDCEGFRLPTDAEWEYAARAGTRTSTYAGDLRDTGRTPAECSSQPVVEGAAWYCANSGGLMREVGLKTPNAWGLHDVAGNAPEFVLTPANDAFYAAGTRTDPGGDVVVGNLAALRGGFASTYPMFLRSAARFEVPYRLRYGALRLVRSVLK